jgi:DtxR family transcriptional regulator, Mn-dependent transcriptional regulator
MLSQSVQDYLKTIYKLQHGGVVSTNEIAKELNVSGASVTGMLKRLSTMGLVDYNSYKGVKLTEGGEKIALEIIRHHRLLELYLHDELGFSLEKIHEEACRLEHYISEEFADKINELLGDPKFDPHGHPIPAKNGKMPVYNESLLSDMEPDCLVLIRRLDDSDPKLLDYLEKTELIPGVELKVLDKAPFNGPLTVLHKGKERIIGNELAKNIFVEIRN